MGRIAIENKLKSIMLAIATIAIVIVNNIGFGSFDLVDARPKFPTDEIDIIRRSTITVGKNYLAGAKYIQENNFSPAVRVIWDEGIKRTLERNITEMLQERPLNKDIKISVETISIDNSGDFTGFSVGQDELILSVGARGSIKFKTIDTSRLKEQSSFSLSFYLNTVINSTLSIGEVTVKDMKIPFHPFTYNISNANEKSVELVANFFKKEGEFDLYMTALQSKNNRGRNNFKDSVSNSIKSAIESYAPAKVLNPSY